MSKVVAVVAYIAAALVGAGVTAVVATVIATVAVGVVLAAGATAIANKMIKSMTPEMGTAAEFDVQGSQGIMVNKTGSSQTIPVIYGETRTGGIRVFAEANDTDNKFLHLVFVIAEGEIEKCSRVYFDGVEAAVLQGDADGVSNPTNWLVNSPWSDDGGKVDIYFRPGTDAQTEITQLGDIKGSWTPHFKGIAYAYLRLEYNEEVWTNGVPNITFDVKGKKVPATSDGTSLSYSDNPARCILDMLTNTRYGKGIAPADLDLTSFASAETYCDTKGFELRGNVTTNGTIYANLIDMLTSCRGYVAFGNKYRLLIDRADSSTPFEITKHNTVGNVDYVLGDKKSMFNKMTAKFLNASTDYKDDIVVKSSATLKTYDNGLDLEAEIPLPFTKTKSVVEQILTEEINQSRQSHMIQLKVTVEGIDLQVGDLVNVTNETFGITQKTFRVMGTIIEPSSEVTLSLREYDVNVYGSSIITNSRADDND